jgi:Tfp pilus tip-associated adhesin PilY1
MDASNGRVLCTLNLGSAMAGDRITRGVAVDRDLDGFDDVMYVGDWMGSLWRVDLTTNPWAVSKLFAGAQPISAQPICTTNASGQVMVFFGTGQDSSASGDGTVTQQAIYGLTDDGTGHTILSGQIQMQDSTITVLSNDKKGWGVSLTQAPGERVTRGAALINGTLYATSFAPDSASGAGGGRSWLYSLNYLDGSAPNDGKGLPSNVAGRVQSEGDGILAEPTVELRNGSIVLRSSSGALLTQSLGTPIKRLMVKSWRQK